MAVVLYRGLKKRSAPAESWHAGPSKGVSLPRLGYAAVAGNRQPYGDTALRTAHS